MGDEWDAWADVGRRVDALADDLEGMGFSVVVRWDRPAGNVQMIVRGDDPDPDA